MGLTLYPTVAALAARQSDISFMIVQKLSLYRAPFGSPLVEDSKFRKHSRVSAPTLQFMKLLLESPFWISAGQRWQISKAFQSLYPHRRVYAQVVLAVLTISRCFKHVGADTKRPDMWLGYIRNISGLYSTIDHLQVTRKI